MFCQETSLLATAHLGQAATSLKCRSWFCPNCAPRRQRQLQAIAMDGTPNRFLTITCRRGQFATPTETAKAIVAAWRTVVRLWRRLNKWHKCEYLAVFEPHQSGWPHLHILWRGHWIDQTWLSQQMTLILNSPVVHISRISNVKSAAHYVAKYFSKAPTKFGTCKRYWKSGKYGGLKHTAAPKVFRRELSPEIVNRKIADIEAEWIWRGKIVRTVGADVIAWGKLENFPENYTPPRPLRLRYRSGIANFQLQGVWHHEPKEGVDRGNES